MILRVAGLRRWLYLRDDEQSPGRTDTTYLPSLKRKGLRLPIARQVVVSCGTVLTRCVRRAMRALTSILIKTPGMISEPVKGEGSCSLWKPIPVWTSKTL